MKYLFICVHPDDLEFNCINLISYLVSHGKNVHILSLTKGEFGIFDPKWKGPRLGTIRQNELKRSAKIANIPLENVHFGNIIDGFVRVERSNLDFIISQINIIQPDIIFAPEAYLTYYWHPDHINCGRMLYLITKNYQTRLYHKIFALYFYTSIKSNFYWPFDTTSLAERTLYQHQSQWWLLKWNKLFYPLEKRNYVYHKIGKWKYVEKYRRIYFQKSNFEPHVILRGILTFISKLNIINPPDQHFIVPDMNSDFGKTVEKLRKKYQFKN